ncbi:sialin-like [Zophobas morio]|uniref:sialin-like n=1 Tax=Zophobas morio TaxID=2755281 RepID=UPI003083C4B2
MTLICSKGFIPTRFLIAVMIFSACFVTYTVRINISINLIAMVESTRTNAITFESECVVINRKNNTHNLENSEPPKLTSTSDYGVRYNWDSNIQSLILGSYFWGYTITCIPGGILAEKIGPTRTVMMASLISGFLTFIDPFVASWNYIAFILTRFLIGMCGGVVYPCFQCLISHWAPPEEKGKFVSVLLGGSAGTVVTWPVLSIIIENLGWSWSFFLNGGFVIIWSILWILLVSDSPETHPRISEAEKVYIVNSLGTSIKQTKKLPPYKEIACSVPFWALIILHFGSIWGLYFLLTYGPKFLSSVLGFNLGHTGVLAALPYLIRLIVGFISAHIGDLIRKRKIVSTVIVRKCFILFSHIVPGILLLVLILVKCDLTWSIAILILSLGSNGTSTVTNLQNSQDLAPNYAGSLYGIVNCIGATAGFITPVIVGQLTAVNNGLHEWHIMFGITATVYIVSGLVFYIFGSADIQVWNEEEKIENSWKDGIPNLGFDNIDDTTLKIEDKAKESTNGGIGMY